MKQVVITSEFGRFPGQFDGEIWGINSSYRLNIPETRHFVMDFLWEVEREGGNEAYAADLAALDIPIVMQKHHPEIPKSEPYPLQEIIERFKLDQRGNRPRGYFTSSISFAWAQALYEGFERIVLNKILTARHLHEYIGQKACLDFWDGVSTGMGVEVFTSSQSVIGRPYPWQPDLYGYETTDQRPVEILSEAVRKIMSGD